MVAMSIAIVSCAQYAFGVQRSTPIVELGLRIVWGGNELNSYNGEIIHEDSPLKVSHELSLDRTGTIRKSDQPNRVLVLDPETRFGGCDISVTGKLDSVLKLKFKPETSRGSPIDDSAEPLETQFTLEQILSGPKELVLGSKSRVVVDRVPGDMLRVSNVRPSWVFAPGETLPIQISPNLTTAHSQNGTLDWEMLADGDSNSIERGSVSVSLDDRGSSTAVSLGVINAPLRPGVYEIQIQLRPRRSFTQVFQSSIAERRIQFIVASSETNTSDYPDDNNRHRDASIAWDRSSLGNEFLPGRSLPVSVRPWGRVTNNLRKLALSKEDDDLRSVSLGPRESLSLPIDDLQSLEPYLLSFSTESTMDGLELHFSEISESGGETRVRPISVSKIQPTIGRLLANSPEVYNENYSYRFTSSSTRALVRITSMRAHGNITLNQFRIQHSDGNQQSQLSHDMSRHKDAPKIIETMEADQWRTLLTRGRYQRGRSRYDTWSTMAQAVEDWLKLCKDRGASCVAIPVLSSGSTLYPTERMLFNPLLNTGVFDSAARDPSTKDIVHWIYVLCDRYDLEFIPVFEWNSSLHNFKNLQIKEDMWGMQGGELAVGAGRWNPYHPEIQVEMKSVLKEFERRYSQLKGYRGYAIHLGKGSNLALAESIDQISDPIVNKLLSDQYGRIPNEIAERRVALSQLSGNAIYLKHQQALMGIINEWNCDLAYIFTDIPPSVVDLAQTGSTSMVYVHASSPNLGPWIARRWWLEGFRPIAYQTNVMDAQADMRSVMPAHAEWLTTAIPIEGQALQRRIDRIRAWRSQDSTRAAILNANPWESTVNLQWSVIPQNLRVDNSGCNLVEVEQSPTAKILTIPANQIVVLNWENPNANLHTWGTDESRSMQSYQSALQRVEAAVNLYSIPAGRNELLLNSYFDQTLEGSKGDLIPGWGNSINPNARITLESDSPHSTPNHLRVECDKAGAAAWLQSSTFQLQSNRLQATMHYRVQPGNTMNLQWTLFIWNENNSRFDVVSRRSASVDFSKRTDNWGKWTEDFSEELTGFGINESNTFRLQLDVQGDCTMDIDSVSIATDYLLERERIDFRNSLFLARRSLNEGSSEAIYRLLDSTLVRTLLLWMKDADDNGPASPANISNSKLDVPIAKQLDAQKQPEPEKRSADRRWKFWNR